VAESVILNKYRQPGTIFSGYNHVCSSYFSDTLKAYGSNLLFIVKIICWALSIVLGLFKLYGISGAGFTSFIRGKRGEIILLNWAHYTELFSITGKQKKVLGSMYLLLSQMSGVGDKDATKTSVDVRYHQREQKYGQLILLPIS
jgi:hypothetical protein